MSEGQEGGSDNGARPMDVSTILAFERTNLAQERTLMAWIRTATSLISFGFTIYKFFDLESGKSLLGGHKLIGSQGIAMLMISIGILSLVLATVEHRRHVGQMRKKHVEIPRSLAQVVAGLISLMGLFAMAAVLLKW